jgi:hypothetical protein
MRLVAALPAALCFDRILALFLALILLIFVVPLALAQEAGDSIIDRSSWLHAVWEIVQPLVVLLVSTVGPALVGWISYRLVGLLKISDENAKKEMEAKIRDALHAAALNGLKYAMTRAGLPAVGKPTKAMVDTAIDYVRTKSPDTAFQAGVTNDDLAQIILSKAPDVIAMIAAAKAKPAAAKPR